MMSSRKEFTPGTHNEVAAPSQGVVLQAGTIAGSVYFGDAALAEAQAEALVVHRKLEETYRRLDSAQRRLIDRTTAHQSEPQEVRDLPPQVQVVFHQADRAWAAWIADVLSETGYRPVLSVVTAGTRCGPGHVVGVISPEFVVAAPPVDTCENFFPVVVRGCGSARVPVGHLDLVGVTAERARGLLLAHLGVGTPEAALGRRRVPPPSLRVRDLDDPVLLGVHPSPRGASKVPQYVRRDVEDGLADALAGNALVLIIGDSAVGKTRLAYEFARERLSDHWFVAPRDARGLLSALRQADMVRECVVWLDNLERFLGPDGGLLDELTALLRKPHGHVVLLGTIRSREHARLNLRWESRREEAPGWSLAGDGRDVLRLAHEVRLDRRWSAAEAGRAARSLDARVRKAVRHGGAVGPAEYLAAGPQLMGEWRDAWSVGVRPRGAALIAAAIDACRAGMHRGVTVDLLRRLHGHYLDTRGGAALRPEPFEDALAWALQPTEATTALLVPAGYRRYRPFDYLVDATDSDIPGSTWRTLIARATARDCWHVGQAAYARRALGFAEAAFRRAAGAGNPAAELRVADCIGESGRRRDALAALHILVGERRRRLVPGHPDLLDALAALAGWTGRAGDLRGAVALFEEVVAEQSAVRGAAHPDTLAARHHLANWRGRAGDLGGAVADYERLVRDRDELSGPEHPDTLAARHELANWSGRAGHVRQALLDHLDVVAARTRVLGADHVDTLRGRHRAARLACEVQGPAEGLRLFEGVLADRTQVLGATHPDTLRTRAQVARWTGKAGRATEAAALYGTLARDSDRVLGARHPDTIRRRHQQARWIGESGDVGRAVVLLRRVIDDWTDMLGPRHPYALISRYRLAEYLHRAGDRAEAVDVLAGVLDDDRAALGEGHPYSTHARDLLERWRAQPQV